MWRGGGRTTAIYLADQKLCRLWCPGCAIALDIAKRRLPPTRLCKRPGQPRDVGFVSAGCQFSIRQLHGAP
jgi:hypothetical protein